MTRDQKINKIIKGYNRGHIDDILFNDKYNALNRLSDSMLTEMLPKGYVFRSGENMLYIIDCCIEDAILKLTWKSSDKKYFDENHFMLSTVTKL